MIYTFWEGTMPAYVQLCLDTWRVGFTLLDFNNLHRYTDVDITKLGKYSYAQVSDIVRAHVLRDNGGYWIDADTIMLSNELPETNMIGWPEDRCAHCGYLHFARRSPFLMNWANEQDKRINENADGDWSLFANGISDFLLEKHPEVRIEERQRYFPESYMIPLLGTYGQYNKFYFGGSYSLDNIRETPLIMLHNSWTPAYYKELTKTDVLSSNCTLSKMLKEAL